MMIRIMVAGMFAWALAVPSLAQDEGRILAPAAPLSQSEQWLQIQREGSAASRTPQAASPAERELALQRLLDSYQHPIPMFFDQDAGGEVSRN